LAGLTAGLNLASAGPLPVGGDPQEALTDEAAVTARASEDLRVDPVVGEGDIVGQGAPLLRLRRHPGIVLTAPMAGRVASIELGPASRLTQAVLFLDAGGDRFRHDTSDTTDVAALRRLLQGAGLWRSLRSRPFGRMPLPDERPAAIFVMAADTRPGAPDPRMEVAGAEEDLARGIAALTRLAEGTIFLCQEADAPLLPSAERVQVLRVPRLHPLGLAGIQIHRHRPADLGAPVWDVHVGDVAAMGALLATGYLPQARLVSVTGPALREARLVRCQPGADLRGLCHAHLRPGPHVLLSGSSLDGREARWLDFRARQVTALSRPQDAPRPHWFRAALGRASRPLPVIPTAALDQALGGALPTTALLRALAAGDPETAVRLGALSLLEEDLALADYVTCAEPRLSGQLRGLLDRIAAEAA
jgi:Na+-transporting NADH:ubiquinone oxidoreductase subunit A